MSPTYTFQQVAARRSHRGACPLCGKSTTRSRNFVQTINPYNRNADGTIKTLAQVRAAVEAQADAWVPDFTHDACAGGAR